MEYAPFQQRVVEERNALEEKIRLLKAFIQTSAVFPDLPVEERGRLRIQLKLMQEYSDILFQRIDHFVVQEIAKGN
jgi:7-keto-8-aminopelargonate synthetase-like enzyme